MSTALVIPCDALATDDLVLREILLAIHTHQAKYGARPHTLHCSRRTRDALLRHWGFADAIDQPLYLPCYVMGVALFAVARIPDGEIHAFSEAARPS